MPLLSRIRGTLRVLFRSRELDASLDEELESVFELLTEEKIRRGASPQQARRDAAVGTNQSSGPDAVQTSRYSTPPPADCRRPENRGRRPLPVRPGLHLISRAFPEEMSSGRELS